MTARSTTKYGRSWIIDLIQPSNRGRTVCVGGNSIAKQAEEHAIGGLPGAYFLAVKEEGAWVIVHDGQATPACAEIAPCDLPVVMVPECLDAENNLVVRPVHQQS